MAEYIHLTGSEDVKRAASAISSSAESMRQSVGYLDDTLHRALNRFEELVSRLEAAASASPPSGGGR